MINTLINKTETATLLFVKLDRKSDADEIARVFDCYTSPAINDELILDFSFICEDKYVREQAIEMFGYELVDALNGHLVLFHA